MRLCFIADANSIHTQRWIEPLLELGHHVTLISYKPIRRNVMPCRLFDLTKITNIRKIRFLVWGLWIRNFLHKTPPDLLHAHQLQAAGWLAAMSGFQPLVVSSWGSDLLVEPGRSHLRRRLINVVLHRATAITVPSAGLSIIVNKFGIPDSKIYSIPWGLETDIFYPSSADRLTSRNKLGVIPGEQLILCPRSIQRIYNFDILLSSFVDLKFTIPMVKLMLVDYNPNPKYKRELLDFIYKNNIEDNVIWINAQNRDGMANLYRAADITISIPTSEGFGSSVYEALACGCPTIISDLPTFHSLADGKEVIKVPVRDIEHTRAAMIRLLRDTQTSHYIRQNGISAVKRMTLESQVEKAQNLYRILVSQEN